MKILRSLAIVALVVGAGTASAQNAQNGQGQGQGGGIRGVTRRTPAVVYGQTASQFFGAAGVPLNTPANNGAPAGQAQAPGAVQGLTVQRNTLRPGMTPNAPQVAGYPNRTYPAQTRPAGAVPTGANVRQPAASPTSRPATNAPAARR